jgi:predicted transcriptional regulator
MTVPIPQISRILPDKGVLSSAEYVPHTLDNIPVIQEILSAISDNKSLAIFRVIAEHDASGMESYIISRDLQLTHKKYYRRLADLIMNGLIIRKKGSRKYVLTSLGKVVYSNLLSIQYAVDNIWRFKAIDAIKVCDDDIYKDIDKISNGLVETIVHKEHIKEILKKGIT